MKAIESDYSFEEQSKDENHRLEERNYWLNKLSGDLEKTSFPYEHEKVISNKREIKSLDFSISGEFFSDLMRLSNNSDIRLYIILTTIVVLLLEKYTGSKDITVGAPIYRQNIKGDFINKIVILRILFLEKMSFKELLLQISQTNFEAVEHINYPLETIPYELNIPFSSDEFPLFDVAILLENLHDKSYIQHLPLNVVFSFTRNENCIEGNVEYNSSLYGEDDIQRIISHFITLAHRSLTDINLPITNLSLMSDEELKQLVVDMNATADDYPCDKTIQKLFQEQVDRNPHNIAVMCQDTRFTYSELNELAERLADRLRQSGVATESIVAILLDHSIWLIVSILAVMKAGGAYLPIDPEYFLSRINFILIDSCAKYLIADINTAEKLQFSDQVIDLENSEFRETLLENCDMKNCPACSPQDGSHPNNLAYVLYTSGSTGKPKGVLINHSSVANYALWAARTYIKDEKLNFPLYSSISFDLTVTSLFTPLITGNTILIYKGKDKHLLIEEIIDDQKVGVIKLTPSHLYLLNYKELLNSKVKCFIVGGEALETRIARDIFDKFDKEEKGIEIFNEYGPTEATVGCLIYKFNSTEDHRINVPIGRPITETQVYLLNSERHLLPVGVSGEIFISGKGVARGYLNQPLLTSEKFIANPFIPDQRMYVTGDLARWLPNRNLEFLGRKDNQVKIRGYRIELGEIEQQLLKHEYIKEAVVIARDAAEKSTGDEKQDKYLCAYFVSSQELNMSELREFLLKDLADYMVPLFFSQLGKIPLTSNGKINIKALPVPEIKKEINYVAPRDEVEEKLVNIWSDVLRIDRSIISIDSSFFELGGQSLKQVNLISQVHKKFNVRVPLAEVFQRQTIRGLSEYIRNATEEQYLSIKAVEEKHYYDMSSSQRRLYILQNIEFEDTLYNVPFLLTVAQEIDRERFEDAFRQLIDRHESLRSSFIIVDQRPVQRINKHVSFTVEYTDLSDYNAMDGIPKDDFISGILNRFVRPFDLSQAPLCRLGLIKVENQHFLLMLDTHHIISDGVSIDILSREFTRLYGGENAISLPALRIQYKDYSEWQNRESIKGQLKKQEEYWIKEFEGEIPVLNLPYDFPRPVVQNTEGNTADFIIGKEETAGLNALAVRYNATLYFVLMTALNILLAKLTNQEDILVGVPVAGRMHSDLENLIGMFVNTLVIRSYPQGKKKIEEFLSETRTKALKDFENQEYQFEDLLGAVGIERDISRNPMFDIMFSWLDMIRDTNLQMAMGFTTMGNTYHYARKVAKFDINFIGNEQDGEIFFVIEYCTRLFKEKTILRFINYFKQILTIMVKTPTTQISQIEIMSHDEKEIILHTFNDTETEFPHNKTIHGFFTQQVEKIPHNVVLIYRDRQLSYNILNEKANRLSNKLRRKSISRENIVAIMTDRSPEMMIGLMGILKAGGAYLPIDPSYPEDRIRYILKDSGAMALLIDSDRLGSIRTNWEGECFSLKEDMLDENSANPQNISTSSDIMYVIYTSGTTGYPKGVMIHHTSLINRLYWMQKKYPLDERSTLLQKTTFTFDVSVWELFWWVISGSRLCFLSSGEEKDPSVIVCTIERENVTVTHFVPSMLNLFLKYIEETGSTERLSGLKRIYSSGEALTAFQVKEFNHLFSKISLTNLYGPTEAAIDVSYFDCVKGEVPESIPIGKPIHNIQLFVLNKYKYPQPIKIAGELFIGGVGLARGYLNRPELTAEKFLVDGRDTLPYTGRLYRTGDLGRWLSEGNIEFLGRLDHQVKIRGFRIELEEIEQHLMKYDDIKEAVVINHTGAKDDTVMAQGKGEYLSTYVVSETEHSVSELKSYLSCILPDYMIPSFFFRVKQIPLTPNGKIDRRALTAYGTRLNIGREFIAPSNDIEKQVSRLWKEVLNLDKVGINDNFFDLGGNSLDLINLNAMLNKEFKRKDSMMVMFRHRTIRSYSLFLSQEKSENERPIDSNSMEQPSPFSLDKVKRDRQSQRNKRRGKSDETL